MDGYFRRIVPPVSCLDRQGASISSISHDLGVGGWRWLVVDVVWATIGGLIIGGALGALVARLVVYLRSCHQESIGLDEFLPLGLIAIAYGVSVISHTDDAPNPGGESSNGFSEHTDHTSAYMMQAVRGFNGQMERIGDLAVVLVIGAMLTFAHFSISTAWLLVLVIRPASVWLGLFGTPISGGQRVMIAWFGIRGIGSIYYLLYAIHQGLPRTLAEQIVSIVFAAVTISMVLHGISVPPVMRFYRKGELNQGS